LLSGWWHQGGFFYALRVDFLEIPMELVWFFQKAFDGGGNSLVEFRGFIGFH
jgi:hypothetical protein